MGPELVASGVLYFHERDEDTFFAWLEGMACVDNVRGVGRDLFIQLKRQPTQSDLYELRGFFQRYGIDTGQLAELGSRRPSAQGTRTQMTDADMTALAKRFFECIESGDVDGLVACYAPDAEIWRNTDGQVQGPADNRATLTGLVRYFAERRYHDRRLDVFPGGFVQQHVLRATRARDGAKVALAACIVCRVTDGKITRLDEYFDSAAVAAFTGA